MEDHTTKAIAVIKAEMIWVVLIILAMFASYKIGVLYEKVGALEDIIFNEGIYRDIRNGKEEK